MSAKQTEQEEAFALATKALMAMPPEERFQYVKGIIESLANAIKVIAAQKGLNQAKMAKQFVKELDEKATTLVPPIMYTIKEEFQPVYIHLIQTMAGE